MHNSNVPIVKPHKTKEYEFKQSKYEVAPRIPFSQIVIGPSGSGKNILLQNMILDIYRDCFSRAFIFSASIHVDSVWHPVKNCRGISVRSERKWQRHWAFLEGSLSGSWVTQSDHALPAIQTKMAGRRRGPWLCFLNRVHSHSS